MSLIKLSTQGEGKALGSVGLFFPSLVITLASAMYWPFRGDQCLFLQFLGGCLFSFAVAQFVAAAVLVELISSFFGSDYRVASTMTRSSSEEVCLQMKSSRRFYLDALPYLRIWIVVSFLLLFFRMLCLSGTWTVARSLAGCAWLLHACFVLTFCFCGFVVVCRAHFGLSWEASHACTLVLCINYDKKKSGW
ncbi:hypothetical protein V6N13_017347 [Hibiscus sabdariffa]|uniref:Uncharacterized protein n=1 Tax=Hibiscus sabdariffa TaxID=183260 RepID=A0ABR2CZ30_9ROSI